MTTRERIALLDKGLTVYRELCDEFGVQVSHQGTEHERCLWQLHLEELAKYGKQRLDIEAMEEGKDVSGL